MGATVILREIEDNSKFWAGQQGALWEVGNRTSLVCDLQRYKI